MPKQTLMQWLYTFPVDQRQAAIVQILKWLDEDPQQVERLKRRLKRGPLKGSSL
jgi:hypothetical protein